jgi:hypothetical protein
MLNRNHKKKPQAALVALTTLLLAIGCSTREPARVQGEGNPNSSGQKPSLEDAILTEKKIPNVSRLQLDDSDFRIIGLRPGEQDYMSGPTPIVNIPIPEKADYVEVIRCSADTIIKGPTHDLKDVELGSTSMDDEKRIFIENDFWSEAARQTNHCILVSQSQSTRVFADLGASSGEWIYVVRACVSPDRLTDKSGSDSRNCSRQVGLSWSLKYKNNRLETEKAALAQVQTFRDQVDGLGREIYYLTVALNNALTACNDTETQRQIRVKRKEAITQIAGFGISLGLELALPSSGLAAVKSGAKTWTQLWTDTWDARDTIAGQGAQVTQALRWLFSSSNDFPRTCTKAKEIASTADTKQGQLKNTHKLLAQAADEAETLRKSREGFEGGE